MLKKLPHSAVDMITAPSVNLLSEILLIPVQVQRLKRRRQHIGQLRDFLLQKDPIPHPAFYVDTEMSEGSHLYKRAEVTLGPIEPVTVIPLKVIDVEVQLDQILAQIPQKRAGFVQNQFLFGFIVVSARVAQVDKQGSQVCETL